MNLLQLFSKLEIKESDSLIMLSDRSWKRRVTFPSRVVRLLEDTDKWDPKAIFCFDNKPLILFFENPTNKEDLHKAVWNFNETPIVVITENDEVNVYNGFAIEENTSLLKRLGGNEILNDFNYFHLVTGKTFEKYNEDFNYKNRVDYKLLGNIEETQKELCDKNKYNCSRTIANALLGKIIFIRYLIDRKVKLNFEGVPKVWTNSEFCDLLQDKNCVFRFFEYLQNKENGFNGDLFPIDKSSFDDIPDGAFTLIKRLLEGDEIRTGQRSLFQLYDFSILPIEFISNVYEKFIGKENQADAGAYYTPTFLVDYIISQTVAKKLNTTDEINCKVLDPACGSGIFLVESLRKIIEKYIWIHGVPDDKQAFKEVLKRLAQENIFGIDKDESAVQVAIFSVYLTLLDYQKPAEIENFKFPSLLNSNFFVADFFDTDADYNSAFENRSFDFILGNPPWFRGKGEKEAPLYVTYINNRHKQERSKDNPPCEIGDKQIAQAFVIRSSDFSNVNTKNVLILTSKVLYNLQSKGFREYLLHNFSIERVFELAPVRREVFEKSNKKAITPACVLFYTYDKTQNTDSNLIEHITLKPSRFFSLFKIFTINRADFKKVRQSLLKEYDWLWKTLVYGSYLDFNFISRLKNEYPTINSLLNSSGVLRKQGIKRIDGNKKINVTELYGWNFLDLTKDIKQNYISKKHDKWELNEVGYIYREDNKICKEIFTPPMLLIKETVNTRLESISAVSSQKLLFTDKITSLKLKDDSKSEIYQLLSALLNSSLFAYYVTNISSTAGIMIEQQINDEERFSFPYIYSKDIIKNVLELEELSDSFYSGTLSDHTLESIISQKKSHLDEIICDAFKLSEEEKVLCSYSVDVTIPIQMRHKGYTNNFASMKSNDPILEDYAQLYINRFASGLSGGGKKFMVEIRHTNQIIGMFFKVVPESDYSGNIRIKDKLDESAILKFLAKLGSEKITDQLFVQKDIRGFEKDCFYIVKPNERRLWHKAIGYLDVNEFADALLKAGRDFE